MFKSLKKKERNNESSKNYKCNVMIKIKDHPRGWRAAICVKYIFVTEYNV